MINTENNISPLRPLKLNELFNIDQNSNIDIGSQLRFKYLRIISAEMKKIDEEIEERRALLENGFSHADAIRIQNSKNNTTSHNTNKKR